jgi:hypothetical protein
VTCRNIRINKNIAIISEFTVHVQLKHQTVSKFYHGGLLIGVGSHSTAYVLGENYKLVTSQSGIKLFEYNVLHSCVISDE